MEALYIILGILGLFIVITLIRAAFFKEEKKENTVLEPETVEIPLKQHIGAPSTAVVAVGDKVKKGDVIGQMDEGKLGANVYASFDGEVVAVTDRVVIRRESK